MSLSVPNRLRISATILLVALLTAAFPLASHADPTPRTSLEETADSDDAFCAVVQPSSHRSDALVKRARHDDWGPDELFEHLGLDDLDDCLHFADRTRLRERHARWSEAIQLLWRIDPEALQQWLLGDNRPPEIPTDETDDQLRCLVEGLVDTLDDPGWEVRLLLDAGDQLDEQFSHPRQAILAADRSDYWLDRLVGALTRSTFRNFWGQASIWRRKFDFTGRAFNRISPQAADRCSLNHPGLWNPALRSHRHCWHQVLSPRQREREILQASAAPGLSRHHWGTDVDILSLNPRSFREDGPLHDDWRWLDEHGLDYGFFQTYRDTDADHAHMEERWHWSYYPVAQALWDFVRRDPERFEKLLFERWDRLEARWGGGESYFDYLREHWRGYLFEISVPAVDAETPLAPEPRPGPKID